MQGLAHPVLRESVRDYLVNQQFRRDLWPGRGPMAPLDLAELAQAQSFALSSVPQAIPFKTPGTVGEVELQPAVYKPVIDALADQDYAPKTLRQLCTALPQLHPRQVAEAVNVLSGMGHVLPTQSPEATRSARPACDRLNAHLIRQAMHSAESAFLASPSAAGAIAVNRFQQLFSGPEGGRDARMGGDARRSLPHRDSLAKRQGQNRATKARGARGQRRRSRSAPADPARPSGGENASLPFFIPPLAARCAGGEDVRCLQVWRSRHRE